MIAAILIILIFILVRCAAVCNKLMDKWMVEYLNLPQDKKQQSNSSFWSFDPTQKWSDGKYGTSKAYNRILLKIGIKTKILTDNCSDGWHFCKSLIGVLLLSCVVLGIIVGALIGFMSALWYTGFVFALGFSWNSMFNWFKSNTFK